jgi:hypothetical protein
MNLPWLAQSTASQDTGQSLFRVFPLKLKYVGSRTVTASPMLRRNPVEQAAR